jgi:dolichyl-phosphate beta-glucosyltransferase
MPRTVLVVPCYNEAVRFPVKVVQSFLAQNPSISMVLVNDGSRDATSALLQKLHAANQAQVHVVDRPVNRGKAESVREGLLHALRLPTRPDVVGFWDADLATPLNAVFGMLTVLDKRPEIAMIFGSRVNLLGRRIRRTARRHYLGRVFASIVSLMLQLPLYDTQCGAKLFRVTPDLEEIFREPFLSRWVFDVEIVARWIRKNRFDRDRVSRTIYEFPLDAWEDVGGSKVRPLDFVTATLDLYRIHRRYLA